MRRILFVDDEQHVLDGLRNLLRKLRHEWDMVFALGAEQALEELAQTPFDVIVTDMRMPGMDGASLLEKVRHLYPDVARLVLSGQSERDQVMRALPVALQFMSKPCDPENLRGVVSRAIGLQDLLQDGSLRSAVGQLERLPSVPNSYRELNRVLAEDGGTAEAAEVVERDPAMCAKVLQLVNSAYFGLPARMTAVHDAVCYLGLDLLKGLVLTAHVFSQDQSVDMPEFSLQTLQDRSLLTASLCNAFVSDRERRREAHTIGLLLDVGQVVLALALGDRYGRILREARLCGSPLHAVERAHLGVTHAEVGTYLLGIWGLPLETLEVVCHHHEPSRLQEGPMDLLSAVHVADALAACACAPLDGSEARVDETFLERVGALDHLDEWRAKAESLCAWKESR
jgi:HD-like signal output (HDOD) protein